MFTVQKGTKLLDGWLKIKDLKSVINIVNNINGKLRTPKIIRFHNMIDFLNIFYGTNISNLPLDNSPLFENAWYPKETGFIDSDGFVLLLKVLQEILEPILLFNFI